MLIAVSATRSCPSWQTSKKWRSWPTLPSSSLKFQRWPFVAGEPIQVVGHLQRQHPNRSMLSAKLSSDFPCSTDIRLLLHHQRDLGDVQLTIVIFFHFGPFQWAAIVKHMDSGPSKLIRKKWQAQHVVFLYRIQLTYTKREGRTWAVRVGYNNSVVGFLKISYVMNILQWLYFKLFDCSKCVLGLSIITLGFSKFTLDFYGLLSSAPTNNNWANYF